MCARSDPQVRGSGNSKGVIICKANGLWSYKFVIMVARGVGLREFEEIKWMLMVLCTNRRFN